MPPHPDPLDDAIRRWRAGDLAGAERRVEAVRRKRPGDPRALEVLAAIRHAQGRLADAIRLATSVLEQDPARPDLWDALGTYLRDHGQPAAAAAYHREALARRPDHPAAGVHLARALVDAGDDAGAVAAYETVLARTPNHFGALTGLAVLARRLNQLKAAEALFAQAVAVEPDSAVAHNNHGAVLSDLGRNAEAGAAYRAALQIDPGFADAWLNLGHLSLTAGDADTAAENYGRALAIRPGHANGRLAWGHALASSGDASAARAAYDAVAAAVPAYRSGTQLRRALTIPIIPPDAGAIDEDRARAHDELRAIAEGPVGDVADAVADVGVVPFYFAFHGRPDRALNEVAAAAYRRVSPDLAVRAPHVDRTPRDRPRVGILSAYLRAHTIGKFMQGFLEGRDPDAAEVVVLRTSPTRDAVADAIDGLADAAFNLPSGVPAAQAAVASLELDALIYPEVGMDPLTYALSFGRWAPRTTVFWGHPVSPATGGIDDFVSSDLLEPAGAEAEYAERLIRWPKLPTVYRRPDTSGLPDRDACRAEFGLGSGDRLALCPQSLFKLHPEFDAVLAELAARDDRLSIGLIEGLSRGWRQRLEARWAVAAPGLAERVRWLPRLGTERFFRLLRAADVVLDPFHFGGGNTSYEAFALNVPIVTWPGRAMRARVTLGAYRQMGWEGPVADSPAAYVDLALRLAGDADFRHLHEAAIRERADALYDDPRAQAAFDGLLRGDAAPTSVLPAA